jgi:hypothetical protein
MPAKKTRAAKPFAVKTTNRLEAYVKDWINARARDYDGNVKSVLEDLFQGGCASGMVGELVYYSDTIPFYRKYRQEISALIKELQDSTGEPINKLLRGWDQDDPLALDTQNQNLLAWFGFEETARVLADRARIEI